MSSEESEEKRGVIGTIGGLLKSANIDLFPLRHTLKDYSFQKAGKDFKAALNVALLDFPQGMAYAMIAGFPVQVGIYCSALASLTGPLLASSRFIMLGPTNASAVLLLSGMLTLHLPEGMTPLMVLPLLLVMIGLFMIIGAFIKVSSVIQYISRSVITGYITAAAALIILNQIKHILALEIPRAPSFIEVLLSTANSITQYHMGSLVMGGCTLLIFTLLKRYFKALPNVAITLVLMTAALPLFNKMGLTGIHTLDPMPSGGWPLTFPVIDFSLINQLANTAFAIAFLSILESSSIAKTLASHSGDRVNINQQLISIGAANVVNAFGSGMAVSGSLTRSVLNFSSGARTPMSSIFSGALLVLGIFTLGRYIQFIPRPALAALVISVGISLINKEQIRIMMKSTKTDAATFVATFVCGLLFSLDTAIYIGCTVSIILFLKKASKPELVEIAFNETGELSPVEERRENKTPEISIVHVEGDLFFGSTEIFQDQARLLVKDDRIKVIILRLRNAYHLDATSALAIGDFIKFVRSKDSFILISGARPEVEKVLRNSGIMDVLDEKNFFPYSPENPNIATRNALKRAQEFLGDQKANITIFAKPKEEEKDKG